MCPPTSLRKATATAENREVWSQDSKTQEFDPGFVSSPCLALSLSLSLYVSLSLSLSLPYVLSLSLSVSLCPFVWLLSLSIYLSLSLSSLCWSRSRSRSLFVLCGFLAVSLSLLSIFFSLCLSSHSTDLSIYLSLSGESGHLKPLTIDPGQPHYPANRIFCVLVRAALTVFCPRSCSEDVAQSLTLRVCFCLCCARDHGPCFLQSPCIRLQSTISKPTGFRMTGLRWLGWLLLQMHLWPLSEKSVETSSAKRLTVQPLLG